MVKRRRRGSSLFLLVVLLVLAYLFHGRLARLPLYYKTTPHKVHVALGFHANMYHSYRIDTNDEAGFGKDIRIMRKIIKVLDTQNRRGVPARGVWDIENLFTLQETIPKYAPDLIRDIRRRVRENGDEVILMSYNNALASALTEREFKDSVTRAVSNAQGSGIKDLFGNWSPIVRPQEMLVTPGQYGLYDALGVKAMALYYSAVTFDAFRLFTPPLTRTEAFNPLRYRDVRSGEDMVVIPTYMIGDLVENVSLRQWVTRLHEEQLRGRIQKDVLVFINFDADDPYWFGYTLPPLLAWLPNTRGLEGLIDEVSDLDYVVFTNLGDYLKDHPPVGDIFWGQDLADGNFNGYNSWSEKANNHETWTRVVRNRRIHALAEKARAQNPSPSTQSALDTLLKESYESRLRLLSTTNFGMAAPFPASSRELVVEGLEAAMARPAAQARQLAEQVIRSGLPDRGPAPPVREMRWLDAMSLLAADGGDSLGPGFTLSFDLSQLPVRANESLYLVSDDGRLLSTRVMRRATAGDALQAAKLFVWAGEPVKEGLFHLFAGPEGLVQRSSAAGTLSTSPNMVSCGDLSIGFSEKGHVSGVMYHGRMELTKESLLPVVHYRTKVPRAHILSKTEDHYFTPGLVRVESDGDTLDGRLSVRLTGEIRAPGVQGGRPGTLDYRLTMFDDLPYLFVDGAVTYPQTPRNDAITKGRASLARQLDKGWFEVAPAPLHFAQPADRRHPFKVLKRNFLGRDSYYLLDYYRHSDENLDLANANNHITAEYAAVTTGGRGLAVAMDTTVLANFAFCPMKMTHDPVLSNFSLRLNPFGTYFGRQYTQPTWGNRNGYDAALVTGQQYHSMAPTYNGASQEFSLMIAFFDGDQLPARTQKDLIAFARPPLVVTGGRIRPVTLAVAPEKETAPPVGLGAACDQEGAHIYWEKAQGRPAGYRVYLGRAAGRYERTEEAQGRRKIIKGLIKGKRYFAAVTAIDREGRETAKSREISFMAGEPLPQPGLVLPIPLQLRILWAGVMDYLNYNPLPGER